MGFLDGNGVKTLTAKLKERFVSKNEIKTVNNESLIGIGNVSIDRKTFIFRSGSVSAAASSNTYIKLSTMGTIIRNDGYTVGTDSILLENGKDYEITVSFHSSVSGFFNAMYATTAAGSSTDVFQIRSYDSYSCMAKWIKIPAGGRNYMRFYCANNQTYNISFYDVYIKVVEV